jgi:DNA-binding MarR family transcriptional regulator
LISELAGPLDQAGLEISRLLRVASHLYEAAADERLREAGLSEPRFGLLLWLLTEERLGDSAGISPTFLSRHQRVSKNTVSALLRGLEEQGLIERALDPEDRRAFRIHLSDAGRKLVREVAPEHLNCTSQLASSLTPEERTQLAALLTKLVRSLAPWGKHHWGEEPQPAPHSHTL